MAAMHELMHDGGCNDANPSNCRHWVDFAGGTAKLNSRHVIAWPLRARQQTSVPSSSFPIPQNYLSSSAMPCVGKRVLSGRLWYAIQRAQVGKPQAVATQMQESARAVGCTRVGRSELGILSKTISLDTWFTNSTTWRSQLNRANPGGLVWATDHQ